MSFGGLWAGIGGRCFSYLCCLLTLLLIARRRWVFNNLSWLLSDLLWIALHEGVSDNGAFYWRTYELHCMGVYLTMVLSRSYELHCMGVYSTMMINDAFYSRSNELYCMRASLSMVLFIGSPVNRTAWGFICHYSYLLILVWNVLLGSVSETASFHSPS